jgi:hypothetical protein
LYRREQGRRCKMSDVNWRDKDDLALTSGDISAMAAEGEPVQVVGPGVSSPYVVKAGGNVGTPHAGVKRHLALGTSVVTRVRSNVLVP